MKGTFPIDKFQEIQTPFYYYDTDLLRRTLKTINEEAGKHPGFEVHYAVKANANPKVLNVICQAGLGADCVSGGEIQAAINAGFPANKIVYAGVGKSDWEINLGLEKGIFCFNVESIPELEVINELAEKQNKIAQVCFRINPDVGAHTHANITTGLAENKFGIAMRDMEGVIEEASKMKNIQFLGLHFHIGSQILDISGNCKPGFFEYDITWYHAFTGNLDAYDVSAHYFIPGNLYFPADDFLQPVWKRTAGCL